MKKSIYIIFLSLCFFTCGEQEVINYDVYNGDTLIKFESNSISIMVDPGAEETVNIPISVSTFSSVERVVIVGIEAFPEGAKNIAQPENYSFNGEVIIPANELFGTLTFTGINVNGITTPLQLQLKIVDSSIDNAFIADTLYTILIGPKCTADFKKFEGDYTITTGDSFGYTWDWDGRTDLNLIQDNSISYRISNANFYGWENAQPVLFDLICGTGEVKVVPIIGYTTPGGYSFDITGGSGTYDAKGNITVTFNCKEPEGSFTITETYSKP